MFRLNLSEHSELCEDIKKFFSALLPHEKCDISQYNLVLNRVLKLVHVEDMECEYHILFSSAQKLAEIGSSVRTNPVFTRDVLEKILESNLFDIVKRDGIGIRAMLSRNGLPDNISVETTAQEAMDMLMNKCLEIYDEAFELAMSADEALGYFPSLRMNYIVAVGEEVLRAQSFILSGDRITQLRNFEGWKEFLYKKNFQGSEGWKDFLVYVSMELEHRLRDNEESINPLETLEQAEILRQDAIERDSKIAEYGIPPVDSETPIFKTRYVVLVGKPGIGKTTLGAYFCVKVFLEGRKILVFSEENAESKMLYSYMLPIYIHLKYKFFATKEQILGIEDVSGVDSAQILQRKKMIKMAIAEFSESGRYMYIGSLSAWNIYPELEKIKRSFDFDYVMIDHTLALSGGGETTPRLNEMSRSLKRFKKDYMVSILLLSHASPDAKKVVSQENATGLTKYCKQIEADVDEEFFIFETPALEAKNLLGIINVKRRDAEKQLEVIYLSKNFKYKVFRYDPQIQDSFKGNADIMSIIDDRDEDEEEEDY